MARLQRDLRFGLRMLRKNPLLVVIATLSLGLGIGLNTTVFSAVYALLLRGPAVERADDLVNFYSEKEGVSDLNPNSYPDFLDMRDGLASVDAFVAYALVMLNYDRRGLPTLEIGTVVSDGYFELPETSPELGRLFNSEDFATQAPVVVVTHRFCEQELDSRRSSTSRQAQSQLGGENPEVSIRAREPGPMMRPFEHSELLTGSQILKRETRRHLKAEVFSFQANCNLVLTMPYRHTHGRNFLPRRACNQD